VGNAVDFGSLDGNVYLLDNMKPSGSAGEGAGDLVSAVNGTYWSDGSQGTEQVLNWLIYSLGSIPPTVPRGYLADRAHQTDREALSALASAAESSGAGSGASAGNGSGSSVHAHISRAHKNLGTRAKTTKGGHQMSGHKLLDVTGHVIAAGDDLSAHNYPAPVITDVTGEAVDEKIIYPAQYGSPDMVSDGWYWSATVDTSRPGTYSYTLHIQVHKLVVEGGEPTWKQLDLTCDARLRVTTAPKVNAFTGAGLGLLPIA